MTISRLIIFPVTRWWPKGFRQSDVDLAPRRQKNTKTPEQAVGEESRKLNVAFTLTTKSCAHYSKLCPLYSFYIGNPPFKLKSKNDYPAHGKFTHHLLSHMQRKSVWRAAPQHRQGWLVVGSRLEVAVFGNASAVCEMPNAECKQQQSVVGLICTISRVCIRFSGRPLSNFYSASKIGFDANIFL